jgi:gliding motility-associated-like protein
MGMGTLQYRWSPGSDLSSPTVVNPLYSPPSSGVQKFTLIVSSTYNGLFSLGRDTAEVWVEVANRPVANAGDEFWDVVDTVSLDGRGSYGEGPLTYLWWQYNKNNEVVVIDTTVMVEIYRSGDFFLTITDRFGCTSTDQTHIGYKFDPFIAVDDYVETEQQEPTICIKILANDIIDSDDNYNLSLLMVTDQPKHGKVVETPGDSCFTYVPEPYYIGYDTFTYIVSTEYGFSDEAIVVVKVVESAPRMPEGFSPNGDGINDVLIIENIDKYELNSFIVFNRWGNVVYKKSKYSNSEPWTGIANTGIRIGQGAVPAGIYLYILDLGDDRVNQQVDGVTVNKRIIKGNIYVATDNR